MAIFLREYGCIAGVVNYGEIRIPTDLPQLWHHTGRPLPASPSKISKTFDYPTCEALFPVPSHPHYSSAQASVSHTRTLSFLKPLTNGPFFDLEAIWDEHTAFEFGERAVDKTMSTMVQEPYVNHIPTITGGVGRASLTDFYRHHFVFANPADTKMELVSRTVGVDRVVDEFVFSFTHDRVVDWM
jgi:carboxymethylenebutenolidase